MLATDIPSWTTLLEAQALQDICIGKTCLELGAWEGYTTIAMAKMAKLVVSVDTHKGDAATGKSNTLEVYIQNLTRYHVLPRVAVIVGNTDEVLPRLEGFQFDVIFIDADHSYESCKRDTENSMKLLAPKGLIAWHDYEEDRPIESTFGVTRVADEAIKYHFLKKVKLAGTLLVCKRLSA